MNPITACLSTTTDRKTERPRVTQVYQCGLTPEFGGQAPTRWCSNAERNAGVTVTRVHLIHPGPAAMIC
jgi:hypothetical protein